MIGTEWFEFSGMWHIVTLDDPAKAECGLTMRSAPATVASTAESPHTVARQGVPGVMHTKPGSVRHKKLHPSPDTLPPSSQVSAPARSPSPHSAATHTSNEQSQPGST